MIHCVGVFRPSSLGRPVRRDLLVYLCAHAGHLRAADVLQASLQNDRKFRWIEFDPDQAKGDPDLSPAPSKRDTRWRLVIRRAPEADEQ